MGFWSNLFGRRTPEEMAARAATKADARAMREVDEQAGRSAQILALLERALGNDPENSTCDARRRAAIRLVLANETAKGREAWLSIARDFPDELANALEQVGVCYHLEHDYRSALENYEAAIRVGADRGILADNIAEARKGLASVA